MRILRVSSCRLPEDGGQEGAGDGKGASGAAFAETDAAKYTSGRATVSQPGDSKSVRRNSMSSSARIMVLAFTGVALIAVTALFAAPSGSASSGAQTSGCFAHHPKYASAIEIEYTPGGTGHDEPELMPVSCVAGTGTA